MGFSYLAQYSPDDHSLDIYLKEISKYPLLAEGDEIAIADRIRAGDKEATQILVNSNLRFVVSVAKQYAKQGISLSDLINEGNIGLMRAAEKFDPSRGCKFISYAVWWIRQAILQAIQEQSRIVRLPLNKVGVLNKIGKASSRLSQELGRKPSPNELATELEITTREIEETLKISGNCLSIDAANADDDDNPLNDQLKTEIQATPDDDLLEKALSAEIGKVLEKLGEREARIISLYFGLDSDNPLTLEEIGKQFSLTRERIRQIKDRALEKLKRISGAKQLRLYL